MLHQTACKQLAHDWLELDFESLPDELQWEDRWRKHLKPSNESDWRYYAVNVHKCGVVHLLNGRLPILVTMAHYWDAKTLRLPERDLGSLHLKYDLARLRGFDLTVSVCYSASRDVCFFGNFSYEP
jgi:hypothetical protein